MPHCFRRSEQAPHHHSHHWNADAESDPGDCSLPSLETPIPQRNQDAQLQEKGQCRVRVFDYRENHIYDIFLQYMPFLHDDSCSCRHRNLILCYNTLLITNYSWPIQTSNIQVDEPVETGVQVYRHSETARHLQ